MNLKLLSLLTAVLIFPAPSKSIGATYCPKLGETYSWADAVNHFLDIMFNFGSTTPSNIKLRKWVEPMKVELVGNWENKNIADLVYDLDTIRDITGIRIDVVKNHGNVKIVIANETERNSEEFLRVIGGISNTDADRDQTLNLLRKGGFSCWVRYKADNSSIGKSVLYLSSESDLLTKKACLGRSWIRVLGMNGFNSAAYNGVSSSGSDFKFGNVAPIDQCAISIAYNRKFSFGMSVDQVYKIIELVNKDIIPQ
jgi:hypothetical protein